MSWHRCHMRGDGAQALLENGAVHVSVYNLLAIVRKGCRSWSYSSPLLLHPIQAMRTVAQGPWEVRRRWRRRREGNPSMTKGRVVQMQVAACMMSFGVYFCSILFAGFIQNLAYSFILHLTARSLFHLDPPWRGAFNKGFLVTLDAIVFTSHGISAHLTQSCSSFLGRSLCISLGTPCDAVPVLINVLVVEE
jgi:hypothetical protein